MADINWIFNLGFSKIIMNLPEGEPGFTGSPQDPPLDFNDSTQCFFNTLIGGPIRLINYILNGLIDLLTSFLPKSPDSMKLSYVLEQLASDHPLIWAAVDELVKLIIPLLLILAFVKAWKIFSPL